MQNQPPRGPQAVPNQPTPELPVDSKGSKQASKSSTPAPQLPTEQKAPATSTAPIVAPTQPKAQRVAPAIPLTVNQKSFNPPVASAADAAANGTSGPATKTPPTQAAMNEATLKAKEAVAAALAKLPGAAAQPKPIPSAASIDALSKKVSEMGPTHNGAQRGRGNYRGRGPYPRQGSGGHQTRKIEIPQSDYDFESANAKFNKEDLIKEAIASGSPVAEAEEEPLANGNDDPVEGIKRKDSAPLSTNKAYNKSSSFFDNISSEAKDREDAHDVKTQVRVTRGEEFKKNVETFGQGNVDGGYRGRGRGGNRGRQYGGTYRGGYQRGYGGGYRGRGRGGATNQTSIAQS
jgi:protein LSM14